MEDVSAEKKIIWIWDSDVVPENYGDALIYKWNGYEGFNSLPSVLSYVEKNSNRVRAKYLAFIHDLGESKVSGKSIVEHLILEDNFSYWWMSLFVEKSLYKSSITDAIRLFALEEIIIQQKPQKLRLVSGSHILHIILKDLCKNLNIVFEYEKAPSKLVEKHRGLRRVFSFLPNSLQALVFLVRYLIKYWPLRKAKKATWHNGNDTIFYCSDFLGISTEQAQLGRFYSEYWKDLHGLTKQIGLTENWLQHFDVSPAVSSSRNAIEFLQKINQKSGEFSTHRFIHSHLSWRVLLRALRNWLKLIVKSYSFKGIESAFKPSDSQISLWPLLKKDWYAMISGPIALSNLIWIELFDLVLRKMPHQEKGLFLCENQAWERALIHAWRKYEHGQLIAVAHSTVRFWDLRYFSDQRSCNTSVTNPMPQADFIALNGDSAINAYLDAGYQRESLVECEALRYSFLDGFKSEAPINIPNDQVKVLVLGDYVSKSTVKMLKMLEKTISLLDTPMAFTVKPHPNNVISVEDYPSLKFKIVMNPLCEILYDYDIVYTSNITSSAVEAYCAGLPVIVMLDEETLNYSPLRGQNNVKFVGSEKQLSDALQDSVQGEISETVKHEFFFLDPDLPRWRALLKM
jgi:surface carbohydrate biosynthesis protein (TIGR04326 family)